MQAMTRSSHQTQRIRSRRGDWIREIVWKIRKPPRSQRWTFDLELASRRREILVKGMPQRRNIQPMWSAVEELR
jgi:hypothetical protein